MTNEVMIAYIATSISVSQYQVDLFLCIYYTLRNLLTYIL